ncbi:hypothetical protein BS78_06G269100 [Paspalum vaginatum]|nr:hypothetical protein BS78_06G269100 [Paspalum vaginatum]
MDGCSACALVFVLATPGKIKQFELLGGRGRGRGRRVTE